MALTAACNALGLAAVPPPRTPPGAESCAAWYARVPGWTLAAAAPARLATGTVFDVLELPADAGTQVLRRRVATGPVAVAGRRMRFLVAPGAAEELDGLLDWLEWGGVDLDLTALGEGGLIAAPAPPGQPAAHAPRGAAVWLRPPEQGCEASLPALPGPGQGDGPDLVRLVAAAATECHRARLRRRTAPAGRAGAVDQARFS
ncbi:SCO3374 family protein [Streptomyces sp. NPDC046161]|uniref:SCO3374 family protein n=1 Tax=Streptomyces sp. NPDC046161 TaxID=3155132 RepID=UPI003409655B